MMRISVVLLFRSFSANLQFHRCLYLILIGPSFKYTGVKTSSEHCSTKKLTVSIIYLLIALFCHFLPPYYCSVLFILTLCYIVIIILLRRVSFVYLIDTEVKLLSEQSNSNSNSITR